MANKEKKYKQNVPGKFYVDNECIACDACVIEAPGFFEMNTDDCHAFVKKQATTPAEMTECENAMYACPVDAIGNDGA